MEFGRVDVQACLLQENDPPPKTSHAESKRKPSHHFLDPEPYHPPPPTVTVSVFPEGAEPKKEDVGSSKALSVAIDIDRRAESISSTGSRSTTSMMMNRRKQTSCRDKDDVKKEEIVEDLVKLLNRMMNPRQAYTAMFGAICGFYATIAGSIFLHHTRDNQLQIKELFIILIVYGTIEIILALTFILSLCQTKMAMTKGLNKGFQIICGLTTVFLYLMIVVLAAIVGVVGFYKSVYLYSRVDYTTPDSVYFMTKASYRSAVIIFTIHIFSVVLKCCYCR
uniref:MARVEL domain-containing protein n=1 Tax=Steinernema glaseri TaxID=37863 RepID=A0A1I7YI79_9BILA